MEADLFGDMEGEAPLHEDDNVTSEESEASSGVRPRKIRRGKYVRYDEGTLKEAVSRVNDGEISQARASKLYGIPQATISRKVNGKQTKPNGRQTVFSAGEETLIAQFLNEVASWGYPLGYDDLRLVIKGHLDKRGVVEKRFKKNLPGNEFIRGFMKRNKLAARKAANSRVARSSVSSGDVFHAVRGVDYLVEDVDLPDLGVASNVDV